MDLTVSSHVVEPSLPLVFKRLIGCLAAFRDAPRQDQLEGLSEILFAASLLKEEGRPVQTRVLIAPPTPFASTDVPPNGFHTVRFAQPHPLTPNEFKRLNPAAGFFHTMVGVWPHEGRMMIWGLISTGSRWLNRVAGGRKPANESQRFPSIHVREPGWLLFYDGYELAAELNGHELSIRNIDVFGAAWLKTQFAGVRQRLLEELQRENLPCALPLNDYGELTHSIIVQFVKRIINLVRTSGHGGSLICIPAGKPGAVLMDRWIDCKYTALPSEEGLRFRHLLKAMVRRTGALVRQGTTGESAWDIFQSTLDPQLEELEEAFFEHARFYADLMQVDGALVLDERLSLIGFGSEIRVDRIPLYINRALDLEGCTVVPWDIHADGTRHKSVYRLCSVEPHVLGLVVSQDSQVRLITNRDDTVTFWNHTAV